MRQIVVDHARKHRAEKRGGARQRLDVNHMSIPVYDASEQLVALDRALTKLETESPRAARIVELTYFTGLSIEEAADVFGASPRTVKRLRQFGRAFLHDELSGGDADPEELLDAAREADGGDEPGR
jgi:RNA polymerase sigma factor (TIGR02999 family)